MRNSNHLSDIYDAKKGTANLQVVFSDIVGYSNRKSSIQKEVIDNFTKINKNALEILSQKYIKYAQENNLNIDKDIIKIPTGDGLAIIFPFEGLHSIHLDFARIVLEKNHEHNISNNCERFEDQGWCNCHDNFNLRIGLSEGKGIIYKDITENYNVAGKVINMASRVMDLGDANSILITKEAYENIIDMTSDVTLEDDFEVFEEIRIKHGMKLNIYQYCPKCDYINGEVPEKIKNELIMRNVRDTFSPFLPLPPEDDAEKTVMMAKMVEGLNMMKSAIQPSSIQNQIKTIEAVVKEENDK